MSDSLRYKILLGSVWTQIALLPVWLCMVYLVSHSQSWRWEIDAWVFIAGFMLGVVALPLGGDLDKPRLLKWWLRVDFTFTVILMLPVLYIFSAFIPATIAENDEYIIYHSDGIVANRSAYLARKSGLLMETIYDLSPYEGKRLKDSDYRIDNERGVFYGSKIYNIRQNGSRTWVVPVHYGKYAKNKEYVYHLIDSLYFTHGEWIDNDEATFILPECFTRIDYTHGNVLLTDSISCKIEYGQPDSVSVIFYHPQWKEIRLHNDSVPHMSPTQVQQFISQLKGGKR